MHANASKKVKYREPLANYNTIYQLDEQSTNGTYRPLAYKITHVANANQQTGPALDHVHVSWPLNEKTHRLVVDASVAR